LVALTWNVLPKAARSAACARRLESPPSDLVARERRVGLVFHAVAVFGALGRADLTAATAGRVFETFLVVGVRRPNALVDADIDGVLGCALLCEFELLQAATRAASAAATMNRVILSLSL